MNTKAVQDWIKSNDNGLTTLAAACGVTGITITRMLKRGRATTDMLQKISKCTGIPAVELLEPESKTKKRATA